MQIIAHRGHWWPDERTQNTLATMQAAWEHGFAAEVDVWLHDDHVVCAHDQPDAHAVPLSAALDLWQPGRTVFWNVKGPEVAARLHAALGAAVEDSYVFDLELVGDTDRAWAMPTEKPALRALARASQREPLEAALAQSWATGVWLDTFDGGAWITPEVVATVHAAGKRAFIVSPELHGHPLRLAYWHAWAEADGICTDYPHLCEALLAHAAHVYPKEPWW